MGGVNRDILRLLDANLNRAVEGIRVLEEAARMLRNNGALTRELKDLRHALVGVIREAGDLDSRMLFARDSEGDVLREGETLSERTRTDLGAVIRANAGRAQEAARSLEEYVKLVRPELSARFKGVRFGLYDVEKKLATLCRLRESVNPFRLGVCVTIDRAEAGETDIGGIVRAVADAGAGMVVYRDRISPDHDLLGYAERAVEACRGCDTSLFVAGRPDVALLAGAHGIQVGMRDMPVGRCRDIAGRELAVGLAVECDSPWEEAGREADFLTAGPLSRIPGGLDGLRDIAARAGAPVVATGWFDTDDIGPILACGAAGVGIQPYWYELPGLAGEVALLRREVERCSARETE